MQQRKALILRAPREAHLQEEPLPKLESNQVLVRSLLSTFKHGTEMLAYQGFSAFLGKSFDPEWRVFLERPGGIQPGFYPRPLGSMTVGVIEEVGAAVNSLDVGHHVFGWLPVADWHVTTPKMLNLLDTLSPADALCIDPAGFALGGVLDGNIRHGEKVLITGLGAIGLLAVQYCKLAGATVYAASSLPLRRRLAEEYGADIVLDSKEVEDLGLTIKRLSGGGVDVAVECSGRYTTLNVTLRAVRQCGRVVCVGIYTGGASALPLGEEFLHNRLTLLASLPALAWNNPVRTEPPLYVNDLHRLVIEDLKAKRLKVDGLLYPTYAFSESARALETIATRPEEVIKVAVQY
jgi:threonine dehydrogenase-like Zn-dependent dehydrogenase